jgi:antagonist of KipI
MGYHLDPEQEDEPMKQLHQRQLTSTAVTIGTVQVTGEGKLIILMADCQTTGGYPRIAQVAAVCLPVCVQLKPGDQIRFEFISIEDAEQRLIRYIKELKLLKKWIAIKLKEQ